MFGSFRCKIKKLKDDNNKLQEQMKKCREKSEQLEKECDDLRKIPKNALPKHPSNRIWQIVAVLVPILTLVVFTWQVFLLRKQLDLQMRQDWEQRRAHQIDILYDSDCAYKESYKRLVKVCKPLSNKRMRVEAVKIFLGVERSNDISAPNLSESLLGDTDLRGIDFSNVILTRVDFSNSNMENLQFDENNRLWYVNFNRANLKGTVFENVSFVKSTFKGANIQGANFYSADISEADFTNALYDSSTIFPNLLHIPENMCEVLPGDPNECHRLGD